MAVYGVGGNRIAQSTGVDLLLREDFDLVVNGYKYRVEVPQDSESTQIVHFLGAITISGPIQACFRS